jgi:hypothetical protein
MKAFFPPSSSSAGVMLAAALRDGSACVRGAGERDHAHQRVRHQRLSRNRAYSWHDMQDVRRQHRVEQLDDSDDRQGRLLARLEHDGVPNSQRWRDLAAGVDGRPVERDDLADDPHRFEHGRGVDAALVVEVAGELVDQRPEEPEDADQEADVVQPGVSDRLSVLQ